MPPVQMVLKKKKSPSNSFGEKIMPPQQINLLPDSIKIMNISGEG